MNTIEIAPATLAVPSRLEIAAHRLAVEFGNQGYGGLSQAYSYKGSLSALKLDDGVRPRRLALIHGNWFEVVEVPL